MSLLESKRLTQKDIDKLCANVTNVIRDKNVLVRSIKRCKSAEQIFTLLWRGTASSISHEYIQEIVGSEVKIKKFDETLHLQIARRLFNYYNNDVWLVSTNTAVRDSIQQLREVLS